jgi:uncharacterized protein (TIGR02996 family)
MATEAAFLADIIEHPDEDAPRLIFADWLEEHGEADRAEFIRLQIALARECDHLDRPAWSRREEELLRAHGKRWAGPLATKGNTYRFHRGFVEVLKTDLPWFLKAGDKPWQHPLRMLTAHGAAANDLRRLARLPQLARLAVLNISSQARATTFAVLAGSSHLRGLRGLGINGAPIGEEGLQALLDSPAANHLTHLNLTGTSIRTQGVVRLAGSARMSRLVALDLSCNGLTIEALRALDASPHLGNLRWLNLWLNDLGDAGVEEFVRLPLFTRLRYLTLGYNGLTVRGAEALAGAPALVNLRRLWLGVDPMGDDGVRALIHSPYLHPQARLGLFWLSEDQPSAGCAEAERLLSSRVAFAGSPAWAEVVLIDWPLCQPPA